jgi:hypothetical protein
MSSSSSSSSAMDATRIHYDADAVGAGELSVPPPHIRGYEIVNKQCVSSMAEYNNIALYLSLSVTALIGLLLVLIRILIKMKFCERKGGAGGRRRRRKSRHDLSSSSDPNALGRFLHYLVRMG